jgi:isopenicillin-N epimerase
LDCQASISAKTVDALHITSANLFGIRYPNMIRIANGSSHDFWSFLWDNREKLLWSGANLKSKFNGDRDPSMPVKSRPVPAICPPEPLASGIGAQWALDPNHIFMNHGCFGARPRSVLEAQWKARLQFEARPVNWLERQRDQHIDRAKAALGEFAGMQPSNFGFVTNATSAINAVLRSLKFDADDELLTTNHVYNAVRQTMKHIAQRHSARYVEAPVPLPLRNPEQVTELIVRALTPQTRILVIDHITSPTSIIFPVQDIVGICAKRGVDVLIDGAHAPGMIPLDVESINAAYYTGNLHKWVCAPPGAAFLWVRSDRQPGIHPATISHFLDDGFVDEFNWQATRDISPWVSVEHALTYMEGFGWDRVMEHNHQLAVWVQAMLCDRWDVEPATPMDGSMIGSMTTVPLPEQERLRQRFENDILKLRDALYAQHNIEVPIVDWDDRWWIRPSCQIYNLPQHYERLADAVLKLAR